MIMRNLSLLAIGLAFCIAAAGAECNPMAAREVQSMLAEFARSHVEGDHLAVHWVYKIENQPEPKRLKMVQTYADMDACLNGGPREIMFYRQNKLMGIASPNSGVRLVK